MPKSDVENIDCMIRMREAADNQWSLAIVDPPYGIGSWIQQTGNLRGEPVKWNDATPTDEYFQQLNRVSKEQIIWGANYYNCFNELGGAIIWDKQNPNPKFSKAEIASYSRLKRVDLVVIPHYGFIGDRGSSHPCEKPVELYRYLLQNYAKPGDTIFDSHMGSQSSRIAAWDLGFDYYGTELDLDYYKAGCERFELHRSQPKLFEAPAAIETQSNLFGPS